jgi:small subunit ribosomal protein S20
MANIKSAIRRIKTSNRNTIQNKKYLSTVKTFTKKYLILLDSFKNKQQGITLEMVLKGLGSVYSKIDKATKAKVIHRNTAARKKSLLQNAFLGTKSE